MIYVNDTSGNDSWDGEYQTWISGTNNGPKKSIKNAADSVSTNGVVKIANGQYKGINNTEIYITKSMTIIGESQTGTIINGTNNHGIFYMIYNVNFKIQNLTITNGFKSGSSVEDSNGGAIYKRAGTLTLTGCNFTGNTVNGGGGAIFNSYSTLIVENCTFTGNSAPNSNGGAIDNNVYGICTITGSTFTDNTANNGGAISNWNTMTAHFNRFHNNMEGTITNAFNGNANLENNWWGSNNPNFEELILNFNSVDYNPWIILNITANPTSISSGQTSTITADLNHNWDGQTTYHDISALGHVPDGTPVTFSLTNGPYGILTAPLSRYTIAGIASIVFNPLSAGTQTVRATVDNQYLEKNIVVQGTFSFDVSIDKKFEDLNHNHITSANYRENILVHLKVTNNGPDVTHGLIYIEDYLPAGLSLNSLDWSTNAPAGTWFLVYMADKIVFAIYITGPMEKGTSYDWWINVTNYRHNNTIVTNTATLIAASDTNTNNNVATDTYTANAESDITIDKEFRSNYTVPSSNITTANYGQLVYALVNATNQGPDAATNININDVFNGFNYQGSYWVNYGTGWIFQDTKSPFNGINWTIPSLEVGKTIWLALAGTVQATGDDGVTNTATQTSQDQYRKCAWPSAYASLDVPKTAYLEVLKEFRNSDWELITSANYSDYVWAVVYADNKGPDTSTNVLIHDSLPQGLNNSDDWYSVSYDGGSTWTNGPDGSYDFNTGIWTIGSIESGSEYQIAIWAQVTGHNTTITNTAVQTAQDQYPPTGYLSTTATLNVPAAAFIDIYKEFRDLPWGNVIKTGNYSDKIYAMVKIQNLGPDTTSLSVLDTFTGFNWTGNYYLLSGSINPSEQNNWMLNDPTNTFNGTHWEIPYFSALIGGNTKWLAIEGIINQTGIDAISNHAETVNQSSDPYNGYDSYTAYLTADPALTNLTIENVRGNQNETVILKAVLKDFKGNILTGKTIEFWVNGVKIGENETDINGTAILNYVITQLNGNYSIKSVFNKETNYQQSNATGELYIPTAKLYIHITSNKNNVKVGETFTITYKLGNYGPDAADNVTVIIPLPEGFQLTKITGDGTWTYNKNTNTITWILNTVEVGDPYLHITGKNNKIGSSSFNAYIDSATYNNNTEGVTPLVININSINNTTVTAASTVSMQHTGIPLNYLIMAILLIISGLIVPKRK